MGEESQGERLDRELMELLQELRVVLPGVQVLLAFLLTAPFQQRFGQLPGTLRSAFFASIACATVATALLIAPSAHHRLRWREGDKEHLLRVANREAIWGTVFLAAAIVLALYVITNVLFATWVSRVPKPARPATSQVTESPTLPLCSWRRTAAVGAQTRPAARSRRPAG